jgi:5-methylcytosine-specific restriction endonuclease McrA
MRRQSTLTLKDAEVIRQQYAAGGISQQALANEHGVSQRLISGIIRLEYLTGDQATCKVCSTVFEPESPTHAYCSEACFDEGRRRRYRASWARNNPKPEGRICPHCGGSVPDEKNAKTVYCSEQCNSAAHQLKRAHGRLTRGSGRRRDILRAYIIERDGGRCHLCKKVCKPDEIHLDHLVPLARGGAHHESNLRVACAACNLSKNTAARNEQLMAFG